MTRTADDETTYRQGLSTGELHRYDALRTQPPTAVRADLICADCGGPLVLRLGRYGRFYGCVAFAKTGCRGGISANDDGSPKGWPGNAETRAARKDLVEHLESLVEHPHDFFDGPSDSWVVDMERRRACTILGWPPETRLNIGELTLEQCLQVLEGLGAVPPKTRWDRIRENDSV